jgi:hypothetical protein
MVRPCTRHLTLFLFTAALLALPPAALAVDADGDGHHSIDTGGDDCDDTDPDRYPGNVEICDVRDRDEDCNPETFGFVDQDGDGEGADRCCNTDGVDTYCGTDCDDQAPGVHPFAPEVCNGIDDNCNGGVDDGLTELLFADSDGDGFGAGTALAVCPGTPLFAATDLDCDDLDPVIGPGAMLCQPDGSVRVCGPGGAYTTTSCSSGLACTVQPNGLGTCESTAGVITAESVPAVSGTGLTVLGLGLAALSMFLLRRRLAALPPA